MPRGAVTRQRKMPETPKVFLRRWINAYLGKERYQVEERAPFEATLRYILRLESDNARLRRRLRSQPSTLSSQLSAT